MPAAIRQSDSFASTALLPTKAVNSKEPMLSVVPTAVSDQATVCVGGRPPCMSLIQWGKMRFLITDSPRDNNIHLYLDHCKAQNVTHMVRVCEKWYCGDTVESAGIHMHDLEYEDGDSPPKHTIDHWLDLVDKVFYKPHAHGKEHDTATDNPTVAVHCVAGLGRAPVLVALALMEHGYGDALSVVQFIRSHRRGAINHRQLQYLESYRKRGVSGKACCCIVM